MTQKTIFQVNQLIKSFEGRLILDKVSLTIKQGQIIAFTGKSGVGKSTLLQLIAGLEQVDSGEIRFYDKSLNDNAVQLIPGHEEIRYMAQDFQLLHRRTVEENLKEALLAFNDAFTTEKITQLTSIFKLTEILPQYVEKLSGGEKQRLAMARAMASEPEALLLDEPFTQLDQVNKAILYEALKAINKELGTTIIFITHQAEEIFQLADKVGVLSEQKLVQFDTPKKLYKAPLNIEVANVFGAINLLNKSALEQLQLNNNTKNTTYGVRPESFKIKDKNDKNVLQVKIDEIIFAGAHYDLHCKTADGLKLKVHANKSYKKGRQLGLKLKKSDLVEIRN